MCKQRFMSSRGIRNYVINMRTLLTGEKQLDAQEVQITPMPQVNTSRREAKPCRAPRARTRGIFVRTQAGSRQGLTLPSSAGACLCFQLPLEFTAGKRREGEADDVRSEGQSCREGRAARKRERARSALEGRRGGGRGGTGVSEKGKQRLKAGGGEDGTDVTVSLQKERVSKLE